jgi:hypothetical protein
MKNVAKGKKEPGFGIGRNMDFQKQGRGNSSVPDEDSHGSPLYDMNPDPGAPKCAHIRHKHRTFDNFKGLEDSLATEDNN